MQPLLFIYINQKSDLFIKIIEYSSSAHPIGAEETIEEIEKTIWGAEETIGEAEKTISGAEEPIGGAEETIGEEQIGGANKKSLTDIPVSWPSPVPPVDNQGLEFRFIQASEN